VLTMIWVGVALMILKPRIIMPRLVLRPLAPAAIVVLLAILFLGLGSTAAAQDGTHVGGKEVGSACGHAYPQAR